MTYGSSFQHFLLPSAPCREGTKKTCSSRAGKKLSANRRDPKRVEHTRATGAKKADTSWNRPFVIPKFSCPCKCFCCIDWKIVEWWEADVLMAQVVSARAIYNIECRTCNMYIYIYILYAHTHVYTHAHTCVCFHICRSYANRMFVLGYSKYMCF